MRFYVWIVALTDVYTDAIIGSLVRTNWSVAPITGDALLYPNDGSAASTVITLSIENPKVTEVAKARDAIVATCEKLKAFHFGIIVTESVNAGWNKGNIFRAPVKVVGLPIQTSYLKLVPPDPFKEADKTPPENA